MSTHERHVARFTPQVWVNDNALDAGDPYTFEVTTALNELRATNPTLAHKVQHDPGWYDLLETWWRNALQTGQIPESYDGPFRIELTTTPAGHRVDYPELTATATIARSTFTLTTLHRVDDTPHTLQQALDHAARGRAVNQLTQHVTTALADKHATAALRAAGLADTFFDQHPGESLSRTYDTATPRACDDLTAAVHDGDDGAYARIQIAPRALPTERTLTTYICPQTGALIVELDGAFTGHGPDCLPLRVYVNDHLIYESTTGS